MSAPVEAFPDRLARLRSDLLRNGLDAALVTHRPNVRYLSGFTGSSGMLVVLGEETWLLTDFRYEEQASQEVGEAVEVVLARDGLPATLEKRLGGRLEVRKVGFEAEHVTVRDRRELGERCGSVVWEDLPPTVERLRAVKEPSELERIESAVRIAEQAFEDLLSVIREGMSERDLAAELDYRLALRGSDGAPFDTIALSGERTALPHGQPSTRRLCEGDLLLLDFGATRDGYCSDITRTVALGRARPWQRQVHAQVLGAQSAALEAIRPDRPAADVDRAAREHLEAAGLGDRFGHSVGHGIGLEVHEGPRLYRASKETLAAGNVVTVEPGVYLPGRGGVRIEEDVAVAADGARILTTSGSALREL
ncbi:MAG: aminopeptidase P family protein [Gemmatimonadota bacterium]|nr:MAG: aminopeptidase P family protein [Gemmatimonadota bacterium]